MAYSIWKMPWLPMSEENSHLPLLFLRFGLNAPPVWLRMAVQNGTDRSMLRRLSLERAWLDQVDFFVLQRGKLIRHLHTGDSLAFSQRPVESRFFAFDHSYPPGKTIVYVRVATSGAMVLPLYFSTPEQYLSRQMGKSYWYGILYGGLSALLIYNLVLFFNLGRRSYLFYSLYLFSFLTANLAFTGHAYQFLWPDHYLLQKWSNPALIIAFILSGLGFAASFLDLKQHFPRLYKGIIVTIISIIVMGASLALLDLQSVLVAISAALLVLYSTGIIFLGLISWRNGIPSAKYFFAASVTHASALLLSMIIVTASLDLGDFAIYIVEIAMLFDAILLAFALADQFRILQKEKLMAERLANIDHLTGMYNRRGFHDRIRPLWDTGLRNQHHMSIILLDLDRFKKVNDQHGHMTGDRTLQHTASLLGANARTGDILARWGGEEFILFLPETTLGEATGMAERLRRILARMDTTIKGMTLTASFGVAHTSSPHLSIEALFQQADRHLYRAKALGRNCVFSGDTDSLSEALLPTTP